MNIQEFIDSGVIEAYVFGLASPEEAAQLEKFLPLYPELKEALADFELQVELFSLKNGVPPPVDLGDKIKDRFRQLPAVRRVYRQNKGKGQKGAAKDEYLPIKTTSPYIQVHKFWRIAFFTVFIISKILLVLFIYFLIQYQHARMELRDFQEKAAKAAGTSLPGK